MTVRAVGKGLVVLQVQKLEREIKIRNERFEDVEQQMKELREALSKKGEDLDAAKSELSDLKQQVKEQLTELQISRAFAPCLHEAAVFVIFFMQHTDVAAEYVTGAVGLQVRSLKLRIRLLKSRRLSSALCATTWMMHRQSWRANKVRSRSCMARW